MTKKQLGDLIILRLGFSNQDKRFDNRLVEFYADQVRSKIMMDYVANMGATQSIDEVLGLFTKAVVLDRQKDTVRDKYYVQLPFQVLGVGGSSGIISLSLTQSEDDFAINKAGMTAVYSNLEAGQINKVQGEIEGNRIYFKYLSPFDEKILVKAMPTISGLLNDDDEIPMPAELNYQTVEMAAQAFLGLIELPEDKTNNNRNGS